MLDFKCKKQKTMKTTWVIIDRTNNAIETMYVCDRLELSPLDENALKFNSEQEANEFIGIHEIESWATVIEI